MAEPRSRSPRPSRMSQRLWQGRPRMGSASRRRQPTTCCTRDDSITREKLTTAGSGVLANSQPPPVRRDRLPLNLHFRRLWTGRGAIAVPALGRPVRPRCAPPRLVFRRSVKGEAIGAMADDVEATAALAMVEGAKSIAAHRPIALIGAIGIVVMDRAVLAIGLAEEGAGRIDAVERNAAEGMADLKAEEMIRRHGPAIGGDQPNKEPDG